MISVGRISAAEWESAGVASGESFHYEREKSLKWTLTLDDIAYIEKIRDGRAPEFQMELRGDGVYLSRRVGRA